MLEYFYLKLHKVLAQRNGKSSLWAKTGFRVIAEYQIKLENLGINVQSSRAVLHDVLWLLSESLGQSHA
jgi:hypothetical protein